LLSFGGSGEKLLAVATNEDQTISNSIHLYYFTGAGTFSISTQGFSFETSL